MTPTKADLEKADYIVKKSFFDNTGGNPLIPTIAQALAETRAEAVEWVLEIIDTEKIPEGEMPEILSHFTRKEIGISAVRVTIKSIRERVLERFKHSLTREGK